MYLLDTHTFYWFITNNAKLPAYIRYLIETSEHIYISIASFWEMAIKANIGKLILPATITEMINDCTRQEINILPISASDLEAYIKLPRYHHDPFDRLIISQGMVNHLTLLTADHHIAEYDIDVLWE